MAESPLAKPAQTVSTRALPAEPAQSPVERVTEKKAKETKKVMAGRACASARQIRLLEQLRAAKESLRPGDGTSAPPKEADRERIDKRPEHNRNWIPRIIGACLAGGSLRTSLRASPVETCACAPVPRRWRQVPHPKSRMNLAYRPPLYGIRP